MTEFFQQRQMTSMFSVAALLVSDPILSVLRREIRRLGPGCKVETHDLQALLQTEVLKRDVFDGDEAKQAGDFLKKAARRCANASLLRTHRLSSLHFDVTGA